MTEFGPIIDVTCVEVLHDRVVRLTFEDGTVKTIDLAPYLWGELFEHLAASDEEFAKVSVDPEAGTIVWPNGADLSPSMLYSGVASGLPAS